MVHAVRKHGTINKAGLFQPLFILDIEVYEKKGRDIQQVKEIKNGYPYQSIPFEIQKSAQAMFLAEILYKTLREEEPNSQLFGFLENSLKKFDVMEKGKNYFHLHFLSRLTEYLGILPEISLGEQGSWFDMKKGELVYSEPSHPFFMNQEMTKLLGSFLIVEANELNTINITKQQKNLLLTQLIDYYHIHFENLGSIKSLPVLKEIFR